MKRNGTRKDEQAVIFRLNKELVKRLRTEAKIQRRSQKAIVEIALESLFGMTLEPK